MKRLMIGLLMGLVLGGGAAEAVTSRTVVLRNGDNAFLSDGQIACAVRGRPTTISCGKISRPNGYTVAINRQLVSVSRGDRFVFSLRCC